jgi:hypothetical protein
MNLSFDIIPMKGLGDLTFGMKAEEVKNILGEPEEIEDIDNSGEFKTVIWHYWAKGLSVFFDEDNGMKLSSIEVDNSVATLWGNLIFQMTEPQIINLFKEKGYEEVDSEEQDWGEKRVSFDDAMVDLYFEDGDLTSINYGVYLDDFEIAVWPN